MEEIERLFQLEGDFESSQKEFEHLENTKNVDDFEKGDHVIQLQKEKVKQRGICKIELRCRRKNRKRGI